MSVKISALEQPQKLFLILLLLFIWFETISLIGTVAIAIREKLPLDAFAFSLLLVTVTGAIVSFFAIFNNKPPFHLAIIPAAIANIILAIFNPGGIDVINLLFSFLLLYLVLRYPLELVPDTYRLPQVPQQKKKSRKKRQRQ